VSPTLHVLSEGDLRRWRTCARLQWLHRAALRAHEASGPGAAGHSADASRDGRGQRVAGPAEPDVVFGPEPALALRASYPEALSIAPPAADAGSEADNEADWARAIAATTAAMTDPARQAMGAAVLGACVQSDDGARVRIDVLVRGALGWQIYKQRLATVADDADVDALALWVHVASRAGWRVQSAGLLLVDTGFVYPGMQCYAGLFREVDVGPMLGTRPVGEWLAALRGSEAGPKPAPALGAPCAQGGGCRFMAECHAGEPGGRVVDPAWQLDIVGKELAAALRREGHVDLRSVPPERLSDARHRRALRAVRQGAPVLEPGVARLMRELPWPRLHLRMETIGFAVPVWPGTRPYQVLPFQWSCDVETAPGQWTHHGFLADAAGGDPRRAFALSLLVALNAHGTQGAILAYNAGFERNRIRELAQQFDELREPLEALLPRVVDLFQLARTHYYHPAMAGSWSAKTVFGLIAPELNVTRLGRREADAPLQAFARSLQRGLPAAERERLRSALQAHGQRRTEALRRMAALFDHAADDAAPHSLTD
jgi:hypothetical protein